MNTFLRLLKSFKGVKVEKVLEEGEAIAPLPVADPPADTNAGNGPTDLNDGGSAETESTLDTGEGEGSGESSETTETTNTEETGAPAETAEAKTADEEAVNETKSDKKDKKQNKKNNK